MKNFIIKHSEILTFGLSIVLSACCTFGMVADIKALGLDDISMDDADTTVVVEEVVEEETTVETEEIEVVEPVEVETTVESEEVEPSVYYDIPLSEDLQDYIFRLCEERGLDRELVLAIIEKESTYVSSKVGDNGNSLGLMQIQPKWHNERMLELGATNLLNPYDNVTVGIDILVDLFETGNSLEWVLMAYNGGPTYAYNKVRQGIVSDYCIDVIHISSNLDKA